MEGQWRISLTWGHGCPLCSRSKRCGKILCVRCYELTYCVNVSLPKRCRRVLIPSNGQYNQDRREEASRSVFRGICPANMLIFSGYFSFFFPFFFLLCDDRMARGSDTFYRLGSSSRISVTSDVRSPSKRAFNAFEFFFFHRRIFAVLSADRFTFLRLYIFSRHTLLNTSGALAFLAYGIAVSPCMAQWFRTQKCRVFLNGLFLCLRVLFVLHPALVQYFRRASLSRFDNYPYLLRTSFFYSTIYCGVQQEEINFTLAS